MPALARTDRRTPYQVTFAVLALAVGSFALVQSMTIPVLGQIQVELGTDQATVTWVLTAYLLSASVFTPIVGRVGDAVGKERMLVLSLVMLAVGSLVAALAPNVGWMIAARAIQGVGGGVLPVAFGIIRDEFPERRIAGAVSIVSSLMAVGMGFGIVLAGPIVNGLGYHWLFWLPFIVTTIGAVLAAVVVPESPVRTPGRISVLPAVLLSAWLVCLLLGISQAPQWGWGSPAVIGLVAAAVVLAALWVRAETVARVPLVDMRMMRLPAVWTSNLVALLIGVGMYASFGFIPQFNQTPTEAGYGFGVSVTQSGLMMSPSAVATFVCGLVAAPLAARIGAKAVVVIGCFIGSGAMFLVAFAHGSVWEMCLGSGLTGLGIGLAFACLANLVVAAVPPEQTGIASGMNANIRTIGGAIGSAVMSSIVTAGTTSIGFPAESGYTAGFATLGAAVLAAGLAGLAIPTVSRRRLEQQLAMEPCRQDGDLHVAAA